MPRTIALLTAVLLLAACGGTQSEEDEIFPYAYQVDDFDNGLRLVTVNTGYPNIVALYIVVQVGSRNEVEPGRSGFAHLFEHMMFRGTEKYPPEKWEEVMQAAGAQTNAYTSDDRTVYHAVFSKEDLEPILALEADRFQNLKYSEEIFRTETRAVLSEYNKNFSSPLRKLDEVLRNEAFQKHTYKHTTMGFVEDVENMPTMYDYWLQFFDRYYRPEYTVVSVIGDVTPEQVRPMVEKYWGGWKRGDYKAEIPAEPPQPEAKRVTTSFHAPTLPWISVSFHAPGYSDETVDSAVLDVILFHAFSENSELYKKLVLDEQKVDVLFPDYSDHVDPYLFSVVARVKDPADVEYVEQQMLAAFEKLKQQPIPADELESVKSHLRYQFALGMNSTAAIADTLAHYLSLRRTPETVNKRYALYQQVTPEAITTVAKKYFVESGRTVATLQYEAESPAEKSE
jgi:zinc protease